MADDITKLTGKEALLPIGSAARTTALARRKRPQTAPDSMQPAETTSFRVYHQIIKEMLAEYQARG
jgi:hypothetical protein|tara:strand:- start:424 stop:621 length:198 start_codon:yes stop_codon:yes gene_type:complete